MCGGCCCTEGLVVIYSASDCELFSAGLLVGAGTPGQ